jgi:two-component system response regulator CpxR
VIKTKVLAISQRTARSMIILDIMLPRIDGFQVVSQLRRHSRVPVLMLAGRGAENDLIAGLKGGAGDYLAKTASSRELITRVRALLRRAALTSDTDAAPPEGLQIGPLKINTATRSALGVD